jgi:hypothetical protein
MSTLIDERCPKAMFAKGASLYFVHRSVDILVENTT